MKIKMTPQLIRALLLSTCIIVHHWAPDLGFSFAVMILLMGQLENNTLIYTEKISILKLLKDIFSSEDKNESDTE